ncbi:hypothetical protein [Pseudomonas shirazica]|uniref:hypothetical protein n=1 Tax=Pseudomonas shirazica TaxID=1940636 RepID=UPI001119636D|nr:hypothetical protein [Pseudomonas shirazica]
MNIQKLDGFTRGLRGVVTIKLATEATGGLASTGLLAKRLQQEHPNNPCSKRAQMERLRLGATIRKEVMIDLYRLAPGLRDLYECPLWLTVSSLPMARACDELLDAVTIGGKRLDIEARRSRPLLLDRVDLSCLPINLALLFSGHSSYEIYRALLTKNFAHMYAWYSIQYPFAWISEQLYEQLSVYLNHAGKPDPRCWGKLQTIQEYYSSQLDDIGSWGWLDGDSACLALLVWNLSDKEQSSLNECLSINMDDWPVPMPAMIEREWQRKWAVWTENPVRLDGKECPLPDVAMDSEQLSTEMLSQLRVVPPADPADNF